MNLVPVAITRSLSTAVLQTKKNSPHLFFAAGVVGVVASAVLACKATLKLENTLDGIKDEIKAVKTLHPDIRDHQSNYKDNEYHKDLSYVYGKSTVKIVRLYGLPVVLGGASIAALAGSHIQLTRRNTALTVTLAAVSKAFDEYRIRVQEEIGKERELELRHGIKDEAVEGSKELVKVADPNTLSIYARFFDEGSAEWSKDPEHNRIFLHCQQNYANHKLHSRGHVFLNEVYDSLGLERSRAGAVVGWVIGEDGDNHIDFGMFDVRSSRFMNNIERSILLDFNVDGVIYDKIKE